MNPQKKKQQLFERRTRRARAKIYGTSERPRLSVRRSSKHISAQIIDDARGNTLAAVFDNELRDKKVKAEGLTRKIAVAFAAGKLLASKALDKGIKQIIFDRRGYRYHGRVKAFADGLRAGGLEF